MASARITARADDGSELTVETWTEHEYPDALDDAAVVCSRMWQRLQDEAEAEADG